MHILTTIALKNTAQVTDAQIALFNALQAKINALVAQYDSIVDDDAVSAYICDSDNNAVY
jgi:hypothetical protein